MKYDVKFSCGHTCTVELFGKTSDRERKIKWYEECAVCPICRLQAQLSELHARPSQVVIMVSQRR